MGFFKKEKEKGFVAMKLEEMQETRKKLKSSANYQLVFTVFTALVEEELDISEILKDESISKEFVGDCVKSLNSALRLTIPQEYFDLPMIFIKDKAFFLTLPDAKIECESNYVALGIKDNGELMIVANEYYQVNNEFRICTQERDHHSSTIFKANSLEEFIDITVNKIFKS